MMILNDCIERSTDDNVYKRINGNNLRVISKTIRLRTESVLNYYYNPSLRCNTALHSVFLKVPPLFPELSGNRISFKVLLVT